MKLVWCIRSVPLVAGDSTTVQWDVEIHPDMRILLSIVDGRKKRAFAHLMSTRLSLTPTASTLSLLNAMASPSLEVRGRKENRLLGEKTDFLGSVQG